MTAKAQPILKEGTALYREDTVPLGGVGFMIALLPCFWLGDSTERLTGHPWPAQV